MSAHEESITPSWKTIIPAVILTLLSMVSKFSVKGVELTGGTTLVVIAVILLLWPLIRQLSTRGGSTEFLGLKLQVNSLERRTEENYAVRIEELRSDIEDLRMQVSVLGNGDNRIISDPKDIDDSVLKAAITEYRAHPIISDSRARAEVDKRLVAEAGRLPIRHLEKLISDAPHDQETAMAIAVLLGAPYPTDDDVSVAKLLANLLVSRFERVRYRAARSIERLGRRSDISEGARNVLIEAVREALRIEDATAILEALKDTYMALPQTSHTEVTTGKASKKGSKSDRGR